ncbi:hypothetical protein VIGAN_04156000 [Vigna angularis var. angularis]|uniref:Secreted protein n=1 Tax=Vigna angularis var. angularis TaxID=157739 RepID=A0A0S3RUF6_PHAAN|nr:hypothetical protein VIGAN_04156000 [Vigna angularis var. angularis]
MWRWRERRRLWWLAAALVVARGGAIDDPVRKIGNHLEQREKLGLTSTTKGQSKSRAAPSESTNALEKVEVIGSAEHDKASVS